MMQRIEKTDHIKIMASAVLLAKGYVPLSLLAWYIFSTAQQPDVLANMAGPETSVLLPIPGYSAQLQQRTCA